MSFLEGRSHPRGVLLLVIVAVLWGTTFVVIKGAVASLSPSVLILTRFAVAALVLLPVAVRQRDRAVWNAGMELGFWLWVGYASQAQGLLDTSASRSAFITAVSVVLVPVIAGLLGRRFGWPTWLSALMAFLGVGLLSYDGSPPNVGDAWTLLTAVAYAIYVLRLEAYAARFRPIPLTVTQIWGVVPFALAWVLLQIGAGGLRVPTDDASPWLAVLYLGLVTTAFTTWLQTVGQRDVSAPEAAVVYSSEPVWAALFAALILGERLGAQGVVGAALILAAVLVSQLPRMGSRMRGQSP